MHLDFHLPQLLQPARWLIQHVALTLACTLLLAGCIASPAEEPATLPPDQSPAVDQIAPLSAEEALPPARLAIEEIELDVPVAEMGWRIVEDNGERTTEWRVPDDAAGWHINSARAGAAGNVIVSGHQLLGEALFAPVALGEVQPGQEIQLTDEDGVIFSYRVVEVSEPIPLAGATADELAQAAAYVEAEAAAAGARLTLITGWPDFTTTHRLFVVAELAGVTH